MPSKTTSNTTHITNSGKSPDVDSMEPNAALYVICVNIDVLRNTLRFLTYLDTAMLSRSCKSIGSCVKDAAAFDHIPLEDMPPVTIKDALQFFARWPRCTSWNEAPSSTDGDEAPFDKGLYASKLAFHMSTHSSFREHTNAYTHHFVLYRVFLSDLSFLKRLFYRVVGDLLQPSLPFLAWLAVWCDHTILRCIDCPLRNSS
jgi:hypothetical protein